MLQAGNGWYILDRSYFGDLYFANVQMKDGYTDQGVREALFADCLLLAEETMHALRAQACVTDIRLMPPDTLEDFPYCQCQVTATSSNTGSTLTTR
ncbi:MAG: hypothetical protein IKY83_04000 [Proteobacteria bacterium]|nr:hypothetical protein [Pseudomonadota bacterium]